ncbi:MAG: type 2 isopentenyl-diphosphate Delta-isomerase [Anaerolineae bacterium]|nr:MAG: type 2 isopentenyl-diphosphate Delta-isomerase [Anaerolineae bacterium]
MPKVTQTSSRKFEHIRINLEENVASSRTTGLERLHFNHEALPELDLNAVDTRVTLFGKTMRSPLFISSMTGGAPEAGRINRTLAEAAQAAGVGMGVGSQRAAIEEPALAETFQVRKYAPDILLFANLGAVQFNYGYGIDQCRAAVEMIEADALILHFNALQEAVQPEGDTNWAGLLKKVEAVCEGLGVPVIAKEVGWGFSGGTAKRLWQAGVSAIDVAGAGGTSWSQVEMHRAKTEFQRQLAGAFINWGIPTAESIQDIRKYVPGFPILASGGLRSGMDIAKCIALGAEAGGMAGPFLKAANVSLEATVESLQLVAREIQICMFAAGAGDLKKLQNTLLVER